MCLQRLSLGTSSINECLGGNVIASLSSSLNFHKHYADSFKMCLATCNFLKSKGTNMHMSHVMSTVVILFLHYVC